MPVGPANGSQGAGVVLGRRRAALGAAVAGAAALLVGAGFLAGSQFSGGASDTTRLVAGSGTPLGSYDGGLAPGGQAMPPGGLPGHGEAADGGIGALGGRAFEFVAAGTISAINGSTLMLTTMQGTSARVATTAATTVAGPTGGDLAALQIGQLVLVAGSKNSDGSYQATALMVRPSHLDAGDSSQGQRLDQGSQVQPGGNGAGWTDIPGGVGTGET